MREPVRSWNEATIEAWIGRLHQAGSDTRAPALRRSAHELAASFSAVGQALAFSDDEHDGDLVGDLLARLEHLRADAENLLAFMLPSAPSTFAWEDEVTVVRQRGPRSGPPRIVKPLVAASRNSRAMRSGTR